MKFDKNSVDFSDMNIFFICEKIIIDNIDCLDWFSSFCFKKENVRLYIFCVYCWDKGWSVTSSKTDFFFFFFYVVASSESVC